MVSLSPASAQCQLDTDVDDPNEFPTVHSLLQEVARLQQVVRDISHDDSAAIDEYTPPQYKQKTRTASGDSTSFSRLGICPGPRRVTQVGSSMAPYQNVGVRVHGKELDSSVMGLKTPPTKRRERPAVSPTLPRSTRVASLTKENISLLPTPRAPSFAGSVCGSQQSRVSIRTEGGTVFSRLYQPDFYQKREEKFQLVRDRRDSFHCSFTPRVNRRDSISSRDSIDSESQASLRSAKTDVMNVSSRLYDPNYVRKRNARLQRMRQEREMRECTFTPVINASKKSAPLR